ncbi:ROK family transcriptional regulator [Paenibacillus sp. MSJ-34]|uniref:ROK family transcriptional regulator n=1 Tax=Paenibacillus sp. MSJ-34 TaxID=2841529 RepID=UPI001C10E85D|nr:ROK family transcriptional regulator [Paenibacillus sp. MSJ-34]MBU5440634.1 ROK family transcriptional regulator [Paenibacillus sp. MSJ-34]
MSFNLKYDQGRIRKYHYFMLLSLIQKHKQISRTQLAEITKMSNTSVGKIIKELMNDGLVIEVGQTEGEVGRRAALLELNPAGTYIVGVEMDWNAIHIGIVTLTGEVMEKKYLDFHAKQEAEAVLERIAQEISGLIGKAGSEIADKIIAVGVSMPGLISWPGGEALMVPQFHWENVPIKAYLEQKLDYVVYVDNHVRTVLLSESLFGNMTEFRDSVCIYVGSGVGGAVMINGEMLRGYRNTLGEIGHITMEPDGAMCDCGRLGCLQTFVCSSEIEKQAQKSMKEVIAAYERKEDWAVRLIDRAREYLGLAISNAICMYNPRGVLLAGPMMEEFPALGDHIQAITNKYVWAPLRNSFHIIRPSIGKDSGVIGASALVLDEFLRFSNDDI